MQFKVILEPSDEGGFTVYVPSLPGCISEGDTLEDALKNIREAINLYLEPVEDDLSPLMVESLLSLQPTGDDAFEDMLLGEEKDDDQRQHIDNVGRQAHRF